MKIEYKPGKPIKSFTCPYCGEFSLTGDKGQIDKALEWKKLHDSGMSYRAIGKKFNVVYETVRVQVSKITKGDEK